MVVYGALAHYAGFKGCNKHKAIPVKAHEIGIMHGLKQIFNGIDLSMPHRLIHILKGIVSRSDYTILVNNQGTNGVVSILNCHFL